MSMAACLLMMGEPKISTVVTIVVTLMIPLILEYSTGGK